MKNINSVKSSNYNEFSNDIWSWIISFTSSKFRLRTFNRVCCRFYLLSNNKLSCDESRIYLNLKNNQGLWYCFPKLQNVHYLVVEYIGMETEQLLTNLFLQTKMLKCVNLVGQGFNDLQGFHSDLVFDLLLQQKSLKHFYFNDTKLISNKIQEFKRSRAFSNIWNINVETLMLRFDDKYDFYLPRQLLYSKHLKYCKLDNVNLSLQQLTEIVECCELELLRITGVSNKQYNGKGEWININQQYIDAFFENVLPNKLLKLKCFGMWYYSTTTWDFLFKFPQLQALTVGKPKTQREISIFENFIKQLQTEKHLKDQEQNITNSFLHVRLKSVICLNLNLNLFELIFKSLPNLKYIYLESPKVDVVQDKKIFNLIFTIFKDTETRQRIENRKNTFYWLSKESKKDLILGANPQFSIHLTPIKKKILLDILSNNYRDCIDLRLFKKHICDLCKND